MGWRHCPDGAGRDYMNWATQFWTSEGFGTKSLWRWCQKGTDRREAMRWSHDPDFWLHDLKMTALRGKSAQGIWTFFNFTNPVSYSQTWHTHTHTHTYLCELRTCGIVIRFENQLLTVRLVPEICTLVKGQVYLTFDFLTSKLHCELYMLMPWRKYLTLKL